MIIIDDIKNGKKGEQFNAGSKARADIDTILKDNEIIFLDNSENNNILTRTTTFISSFRKIKKADPNSIFVIQYPLYVINKFSDQLFDYLKDNKTIVIIHDLNSLRMLPDNTEKHKQEVSLLNQFSAIISHNKKMSAWLKENGLTKPVVELELFDYLATKQDNQELKYDICFAGNLTYEKSAFLYEAINKNQDVSFELFGVGYNDQHVQSNNAFYQGSKRPDEIINCFHSKYGLIWDGDTIDTCSGNYGNYERYNNPHKLSMNVAAHCPVIVWKEAAIADFVQEHKIGIVVDDLMNLSKKIESVSNQDYETMRTNITSLSHKVLNGNYTNRAIQSALNKINP